MSHEFVVHFLQSLVFSFGLIQIIKLALFLRLIHASLALLAFAELLVLLELSFQGSKSLLPAIGRSCHLNDILILLNSPALVLIPIMQISFDFSPFCHSVD